MIPFDYIRAATVEEAARLTAEPGVTLLAGGTNLVDLMREYVRAPRAVVDVSRLPLGGIEETGSGLSLGATATNTAVADHPIVRERYAALSEAILAGASQQIRNRATTAGNILQCTRDPFYWNTAYGGAEGVGRSRDMSVVDAASARMPVAYHAVLGLGANEGGSRAANPSDMAAALALYDPVVAVTGPRGPRTIPYAGFHRRTGRDPLAETALEPGDVITAVILSPAPQGRSGYTKIRERHSYAYALASVAAHVGPEGTRVAFGSVAPVPWRARAAEAVLAEGGSPADAVAAEFDGTDVPEPLAFKRPMLAGALGTLMQRLEG